MRPAILAVGVVLSVLGIFLFVTGYHNVTSIPEYFRATELFREQYYLGLALETSGGILTAVGLGLVVFGALSSKREEKGRSRRSQETPGETDRPIF